MKLTLDRSINKDFQNIINRSLIFQLIRKEHAISRAEIARRLSLSPSAVSRTIDWFIENHYITEGKKNISASVGKKASSLHLSPKLGNILSIDFSEGDYAVHLMDFSSKELARYNYGKVGGSISELKKILHTIYKDTKDKKIQAVGFGIPAEITKQGIVSSLSLYEQWHGLEIEKLGLEIFGVTSFAEKDVFLAAIAEQYEGAGIKINDILYLKISEDFSTAIISNGQLIRGSAGTAGQATFSVINKESRAFLKGTKGYFDEHACFYQMTEQKDNKYYFCKTQKQKNNIIEIHSAVFANLILTVNPSIVILGGMLWRIEDIESQYLPLLKQEISKLIPLQLPEFKLSTLKDNSVARGLTQLVLDKIINKEFPYIQI